MPNDEPFDPEDIQASTARMADELDADPAAQAEHEKMAAKFKALADADPEFQAEMASEIAPSECEYGTPFYKQVQEGVELAASGARPEEIQAWIRNQNFDDDVPDDGN